jgi:vesicle coat complex subunit
VLAEMKEYATEVDVDFVRRSVRAIGRCAIKIDSAAERCIDTLVELIQTKVNYVVQEAIVVIKVCREGTILSCQDTSRPTCKRPGLQAARRSKVNPGLWLKCVHPSIIENTR